MRQKTTSPQPTSRCAQCGKPLRHMMLQVRVVLCVQCYDERRYRKESAPLVQDSSSDNPV